MIDSLNTIIYSILALIPGYLMDSLIRIKIPLGKRDANFSIFRFIALSVLNYLPWLWTVVPNLMLRNFSDRPLREVDVYFLFLVLFISPICMSFVLTRFGDNKFLKTLLTLIGFPLDLMTPDAWDYVFINQPICFLCIVLKNGDIIYGYYGENSYVSAGCEGKSLYLEKVYFLDSDGKWLERQNSNGIIVAEGQVSYLELFM